MSSLRTSLRLAAPVRGNQHKGKSSAHTFSPFSSRVVFSSDNSQLPAFGLLARGTTWCDTQEYRLARREGPEGCSTMVGITPGEELEITVGEGNKDKKDTTQFLLTAAPSDRVALSGWQPERNLLLELSRMVPSALFSGVHYHRAVEACSSSLLVLASSGL